MICSEEVHVYLELFSIFCKYGRIVLEAALVIELVSLTIGLDLGMYGNDIHSLFGFWSLIRSLKVRSMVFVGILKLFFVI
jgi:hypothetical protein